MQHIGRTGNPPSLLAKILTIIATTVLLIGAVAMSIVVFAVALTGVALFGAYLWWKTRHLRKQMRDQMRDARSSDSTVIEGEIIRRDEEAPRIRDSQP